jgi:hypothetical protein
MKTMRTMAETFVPALSYCNDFLLLVSKHGEESLQVLHSLTEGEISFQRM